MPILFNLASGYSFLLSDVFKKSISLLRQHIKWLFIAGDSLKVSPRICGRTLVRLACMPIVKVFRLHRFPAGAGGLLND